MTTSEKALSGYAAAARPVRTDRGLEYAVFARITSSLREVDETDTAMRPALTRAVMDNLGLWRTLASDLRRDGNALPLELRGQLLSLAGFVRRHSYAVMNGQDTIDPLIDINTSIMRGLRGEVETAA
ncbi:MAG: flagellar biosynthesis regulator FlaF [Rhodobacteraceae bacterium]|uniref:flagellar biosynthesis regulator FlaF n=1 Tax=Amaricoccus sp. B4 TaxID=3368557 RepID=UPI000DAE497B|nr:flagellar biosynthesis regulator FlaF [Paracoccaceae bacterium]